MISETTIAKIGRRIKNFDICISVCIVTWDWGLVTSS